MTNTKRNRALAEAAKNNVHTGPQTAGHILQLAGEELIEQLTGKQIGLVMAAVNRGYQAGRGHKDNH